MLKHLHCVPSDPSTNELPVQSLDPAHPQACANLFNLDLIGRGPPHPGMLDPAQLGPLFTDMFKLVQLGPHCTDIPHVLNPAQPKPHCTEEPPPHYRTC